MKEVFNVHGCSFCISMLSFSKRHTVCFAVIQVHRMSALFEKLTVQLFQMANIQN